MSGPLVRCPVCGYYASRNRSGELRLHRPTGGRNADRCRGMLPAQPNSICVEMKTRSGRVFRCEVPLGLDDQERAEIAQTLQTINEKLQKAYVAPTSAAVKTA